MVTPPAPQRAAFTAAWWLVLCLVGLDYFSSLSYLPSLLVQGVGRLAPLGALLVVLVTLLVALPIYCYVVGRSSDGRGGTGVIERLVSGWRGKLLILLLLSFVATDYVVTQNLSVADAAEHLRANPYFRAHVAPLLEKHVVPGRWFAHPYWQYVAARIDQQLLITMALSLVGFALWAYWRSVSPARFLRIAVVVVVGYMVVNAIVIASGVAFLCGSGRPLSQEWIADVERHVASAGGKSATLDLVCTALAAFPFAALGLSGFELSMAVAPMVRGTTTPQDLRHETAGRIRNTRKLLIAAAVVMSVWLPGAVLVSTIVVPSQAYGNGGPAVHRALAYLAHGGVLADGQSCAALNRFFGPVFGTIYDAFSVAMLCMAGACVLIALRDYVPEYLQRFGMELELAQRLGMKMTFFNLVVLLVMVLFHADIDRMQWAYVTSVLALLAGGSFAAVLSVRHERRSSVVRLLWMLPAMGAFSFFLAMGMISARVSAAGLEIAAAFGLGILVTSALSRWLRSTELRFRGFDFDDDDSRERWARCCQYEFQVLVPHRPGLHSRAEKELAIRRRHRIGAETPIILIEAEVSDASEFYQRPLLKISRENGVDLIEATRCASVAHVLAAIALEMSRVGEPAELHFGWSNESPLAANVNFLLFGEGNVPWLVRELIAKAEPNVARRPHVVLG